MATVTGDLFKRLIDFELTTKEFETMKEYADKIRKYTDSDSFDKESEAVKGVILAKLACVTTMMSIINTHITLLKSGVEDNAGDLEDILKGLKKETDDKEGVSE